MEYKEENQDLTPSKINTTIDDDNNNNSQSDGNNAIAVGLTEKEINDIIDDMFNVLDHTYSTERKTDMLKDSSGSEDSNIAGAATPEESEGV